MWQRNCLTDNLRKWLSRRRLLLKKADRPGEGASDVKKTKDDLAELNFISWLALYIQSRSLTLIIQLRAVEKIPIMRSTQMAIINIPSKMKTTVAMTTPTMPTLKVFVVLQLHIERNRLLKSTESCQSKIAICKRLRWTFSEL